MGRFIKAYPILLFACILFYQNCSSPDSGSFEEAQDSVTPFASSIYTFPTTNCSGSSCQTEIAQQNTTCFLDGLPVTDGTKIIAYETAVSDNCQKEERVCSNGNLSGSFKYLSCIHPNQVGRNQDCRFNGYPVKNGDKVQAFLDGYPDASGNCQSEDRVCINGRLSGTYRYGKCTRSGKPCLFDGRTLEDQEYTVAFRPNAQGACDREFRVCRDGVLDGSFPYSSCLAGGTCFFDGQTLLEGESVLAYDNYQPATQTCEMETRTCQNGVLGGSFANGSCDLSGASTPCQFGGQAIANGESIPAFRLVPGTSGYVCEKQDRICTNGILDGDSSFNLANCSPSPYRSCLAFGQGYIHGDSVISYQMDEAVYPKTCADYSIRSICSDGRFHRPLGYSSCKQVGPHPGQSCELDGQSYQHGRYVNFFKSDQIDVINTNSKCGDTDNFMQLLCSDGLFIQTFPTGAVDIDDYNHRTCQEIGLSCDVNGKTVEHNEIFTVYKKSSYNYADQAYCSDNGGSLSGFCVNGEYRDVNKVNRIDISGFPFNSCDINGRSCRYKGVTYQHHKIIGQFYKSGQVPFVKLNADGKDVSCQENGNYVSAVCVDGDIKNGYRNSQVIDLNLFPHSTCQVNGRSCSVTLRDPIANRSYTRTSGHLENGQAYVYSINEAPYVGPYPQDNSECRSNSKRRLLYCVDGTFYPHPDQPGLSSYNNPIDLNTFKFPVCHVNGQKCQLDGKTFDHQERRITIYKKAVIPSSAGPCTANGNATRVTCFDGDFYNFQDVKVDTSVFSKTSCRLQ